MIRQSMDETELDRDSIFNQLRMKMSKVEMDNALDFLFSQPYSTSTQLKLGVTKYLVGPPPHHPTPPPHHPTPPPHHQ
jgi:hypothetical protein